MKHSVFPSVVAKRLCNNAKLLSKFKDKLPQVVANIIRADPTYKRSSLSFVDVLVKWLLSDEIHEEDLLGFVKDTLAKFQKKRAANTLSVELRNLTLLSWQQVLETVRDSTHFVSNEQLLRDGKDYFTSFQAKLIYSDFDLAVVLILSQAASVHFGRNTVWCTSRDNDQNLWEHYAEKNVLYYTYFWHETYPNSKIAFVFGKNTQFPNEENKMLETKDKIKLTKKYPQLCAIFKEQAEKVNQLWLLKNPSEEIQLAAITSNSHAIKYIANPSEAVQLAAVTNDCYVIEYIKNPSEAVQLAAVTKNYYTIEYIKDPNEAVQIAAVTSNSHALQYIANPSEAVQLAAVTRNGCAVRFIKNPSEAVQIAAVTNSGHALQYISNLSEAVQLAAVTENGFALIYIQNPSLAVVLAATKQNSSAVKYIHKSSLSLKLISMFKEYLILNS